MNRCLKRFGQYVLRFEGAILFGILVAVIGKYPIELMLSPSLAAERVLNAFLVLLPSVSMLFWLMRGHGYKTGKFSPKDSLIAFGAVFALQIVLTALTDGAIWFSGLNGNLAEAIVLGDAQMIPEEKEGTLRLLTCGLTLLADACLYLPAALWGEHSGVQKRLRERAALTGQTE